MEILLIVASQYYKYPTKSAVAASFVHMGRRPMLALLPTLLSSVHGVCRPSLMHLKTALVGEIIFDMQEEQQECQWHINPNRRLDGIAFNTSVAEFGGSDSVSFYSSSNLAEYVGKFDSTSRISEFMVMTGTDQATIVLSASTPNTRLRISYRCLYDDGLLPAFQISPIWIALWMGVWILLISLCCASTCWIIRYRRSELRNLNSANGREQRDAFGNSLVAGLGTGLGAGLGAGLGTIGADGTIQRSILLVHVELMRRLEQERHEQRDIRHAIEASTNASLRALPTSPWQGLKDAVSAHGSAIEEGSCTGETAEDAYAQLECCLCMEEFAKNDQIRLLPCQHYFHRDCVDRWFAARAYQQRTCPLCKRDPLDGRCPHPSVATIGVSSPSPSVPASNTPSSAAPPTSSTAEGGDVEMGASELVQARSLSTVGRA